MQAGQVISGAFHAGLLVMVGLGALDNTPPAPRQLAVAEVTMISAEMLDAQASAPPQVLDEPAPQAAPEAAGETPPAPASDEAPQASELESVETPQTPDVAADLTPLRRPASVSTPVSIDSPRFEQPVAEAAPTMPQANSDGNERNTTVTSLTPPPPRAAPRIDTSPAEAPPPEAETAPEVRPEVSPDAGAEAPQPETVATAPQEATSQIQPEAVEDAPIAAERVELSSMPVRRPRDMAAAAQAVEAAAEVSRRVAAQAREAAEAAARQAAIDEEAAQIEALLREAEAETAASAQNASLTGPEVASIAQGVAANWNKQLILEQPNYEQYIVRVAVTLDGNGAIIGAVEPVEPMNPTGYFRIAFDSAERAIRSAAPIRLPADRFPNGATLILNFDPVRGIGFN
ncbi:hypothetical protein LGT41_0001295 [Abyssibius alkaniclasticus]|uniref:hypothetical protein n=1 Tax=Abyssibius alkaniclasticus TaxID=2881234 RepID=UPI002363A5A1|nr:hypothetical protein [Abyssibius alkaniclasticus]UPH71479.1 hypothetical protein LGT41_0001295 [Abyssibius alkaniclasticus]